MFGASIHKRGKQRFAPGFMALFRQLYLLRTNFNLFTHDPTPCLRATFLATSHPLFYVYAQSQVAQT
ncbi:MAG: hypothetical protein Rhims3KO_24460 [Hyphomicrobiales bacterium]